MFCSNHHRHLHLRDAKWHKKVVIYTYFLSLFLKVGMSVSSSQSLSSDSWLLDPEWSSDCMCMVVWSSGGNELSPAWSWHDKVEDLSPLPDKLPPAPWHGDWVIVGAVVAWEMTDSSVCCLGNFTGFLSPCLAIFALAISLSRFTLLVILWYCIRCCESLCSAIEHFHTGRTCIYDCLSLAAAIEMRTMFLGFCVKGNTCPSLGIDNY